MAAVTVMCTNLPFSGGHVIYTVRDYPCRIQYGKDGVFIYSEYGIKERLPPNWSVAL